MVTVDKISLPTAGPASSMEGLGWEAPPSGNFPHFLAIRLSYTNVGTRDVTVPPIYSLESRPSMGAPIRYGLPVTRWETLKPGEGRTWPIHLSIQGDRAWRIALWSDDVRPTWRMYAHEWSIKLGIRKRRPTSVLQYSEWFNINSDALSGYHR